MSNFHPLLKDGYDKWSDLEHLIEALPTAHEKGEVFEQFVYCFLTLLNDYYQIDKVYRSKDIPSELASNLKLEITDYGVDGIFVLRDGTLAAYQAKFRTSRKSATVRELSTFWSEASRADHKYVIANSVELPPQAHKHSYSILVDKFEELDKEFFKRLKEYVVNKKSTPIIKASPDDHQKRMISNTISGFKGSGRGKLIAACGAGKTLVSLWIVEEMNADTVLFLAPSLALIKQTLEAWSSQANERFAYLCVCSDESVVDAKEMDYGEYSVSEIDFPVTTDPIKIKAFMESKAPKKFVFSTYNSASVVAEAFKNSDQKLSFDLSIFDEAHRTAGQKESNLYSVALQNENILIKKRLFMTATERLVRPWVIERAEEADRVIFSMDDESIYGKTFDRYSFGEAIGDKVISDYKIVLTAITAEEVASLIQENRLLVSNEGGTEQLVSADNIFKQAVLLKAMDKFNLKKAISFHSTVKRAKAFVNGSSNESMNLEDMNNILFPESSSKTSYFHHVDGMMPAGTRKKKLREFESSEIGIISNAKCLTEGVDVPIIDSIYFVDPKNSLIDIVQACGRALRKSRGENAEKKTAYFIVPVIFSDKDDIDKYSDDKFETLLNLIQALKDQDERLADWVEKVNLGHAKGGTGGSGGDGPVTIDIPKQYDLPKFTQEVELRILASTREPRSKDTNPEHQIRRSTTAKVLTPIGDYAYETLFNNLVLPTLEKMEPGKEYDPKEIAVNNNNVSHTLRMLLIDKVGNKYKLSDLGERFIENKVDQLEVFREAMLAHKSSRAKKDLFPYRAFLELLTRVDSINFIEFLYSIYPLQDGSGGSIDEAVEIISEIREAYPNVSAITSNTAKETISNELNERFNTSYSFGEVWVSTTVNNKFMYFKSHLSMFDGITSNRRSVSIVPDKKQEIYDLIESSNVNLLSNE